MQAVGNHKVAEGIGILNEYALVEEEARASQYYLAEVTDLGSCSGADVGDIEFILTDSYHREGDVWGSRTYGSWQEPKQWEIVAGPFDCPAMPHVLALEVWFREEQPDEAWAVYQQRRTGDE